MKTRKELLQNKGYWVAFLEGVRFNKESDEMIAEEIVKRIKEIT